jgi:hypothetical protein
MFAKISGTDADPFNSVYCDPDPLDLVKVTFNPPINGTEFMGFMEMLLFLCMGRWESTAPPDRRVGVYCGVDMKNSQQARLQYLLCLVGCIDADRTYSTLAVRTRRPRTCDSIITTNKPERGLPLRGRWYLDSCLELKRKLDVVVDALWHVGYSREFIEVARRFVAGKPLVQGLARCTAGGAADKKGVR